LIENLISQKKYGFRQNQYSISKGFNP